MTTAMMTNAQIDTLTAKWIEAKQNEKGWADQRKEIEDQMTAVYGNFEELLATIDEAAVLTTSATIGDSMKVGVGYTMAASQPAVAAFIDHNPAMEGVLFKKEFKPQAKPIMEAIRAGTSLGKQLEELVSYKNKRPGYSQR